MATLETPNSCAISTLFENYDNTKDVDVNHVQTLKLALNSLGFDVELAGRNFANIATECDIIFVDLFLNQNQAIDNLEYTSDQLVNKVFSRRPTKPPIVILISRSERLEDHKELFRSKCGLIESSFRLYKKSALQEPDQLKFCIKKLMEHYEDSVRVWNFLNVWDKFATIAVKDTVADLKKLDLLDHNMVHKLLLSGEGQSQSSYFLELFDALLLYRFESYSEIGEAASELNNMKFDNIPTLQGLQKSPLQELVYQSMFTGEERLKISPLGSIELGDIFQLCEGEINPKEFFAKISKPNNIWIAVTPSCDLIRGGVENIGLIKGDLREVSVENWKSNDVSITPIFKINGKTFAIEWKIKSFMTCPKIILEHSIKNRIIERIAKVREVNALGLQQMFIADFGRIGQRAAMWDQKEIKYFVLLIPISKILLAA